MKFAGLLTSGNGFTLSVLLPAVMVLDTWVLILLPKKSLRLVGTTTGTSKVKGSMVSFPVFWGYSTTFL